MVLGSLIAASVAGAQTCLDDLAGASGCTANDVKITTLALRPGGLIDGCTFAGDTATLDVTMQVSAGANRRYDVGFFLALDAGDAHNGSCEHEALIPPGTLNSSGNPTSGTGPYANFDGDACGEIEQGVLTYKVQRLGSLPETSTWQYRSSDKSAVLSTLAIRNGKRRLALRIGRMTVAEMGMPQAAAMGSRGDLPVRLDVPTAAGTIHFQTTPELVRVRQGHGWKRPAPLVQ